VKAQQRAEAIELMLEDMGIEPERFKIQWVSASEGQRFAEIISDFTDEIRGLGPSPYA
jgi:F420-non-reducing hydrogenase iron-sulfur subunit